MAATYYLNQYTNGMIGTAVQSREAADQKAVWAREAGFTRIALFVIKLKRKKKCPTLC